MRHILAIAAAIVLVTGGFLAWKNAATEEAGNIQPDVPAAAPQNDSVTFLLTGDIMLSRYVAFQMKNAEDTLLPFRKTAGLLASTDFNSGNLESPLTESPVFEPRTGMSFNVPPGFAAGLTASNFRLMNLANNHALDQGEVGVFYTIESLQNDNVASVGTGLNPDEAWKGAVIEKNGVRIGFLGASYASINDGGFVRNQYVARMEDVERLRTAVAKLRAQDRADIVVVNMHGGDEYARTPNASQTTFAHAAIDAGADIVAGHHPHVIQTTEIYKNKPIFYSLGNFIFDQVAPGTNEGLTLKVTAEKDAEGAGRITTIELVPVVIEGYCCPRMATEEEKTKILGGIGITTSTLLIGSAAKTL